MPSIDLVTRLASQILDVRAADPATNGCGGLAVNPDISGIGVRLSFYLQNLCLVLLVTRSWEDAPGALWTFVTTSFGLTVAAMVQAKDQQLSFFQAVQVSNLVWMANFGSYLALASYSRHRSNHNSEESKKKSEGKKSKKAEPSKSDDSVKFAAMLQMFFSMGLTLSMWRNASTFGNQDQCNPSVKYVIFAPLPALHTGRIASLAITSILTVAYVFITAHELLSYFNKKKSKRATESRDDVKLPEIRIEDTSSPPDLRAGPIQFPTPSPISVSSPSLRDDASAISRASRRERKPKRQRRQEWSPDLDPMLLGITIFQFVVFAYFVAMTELLLTHNPAADSSQDSVWGFGQILALIVVVPSLISVLRAFKEHGIGNLHHRKTKGANRANKKIKNGTAMV